MNAADYSWLKRRGITHVVNCAIEHGEYHKDKLSYLSLKLDDVPEQNIKAALDKSYRYIDTALNNNQAVLVHCHAGISRSSSVVINYIMRKYNISFKGSMAFVKNSRSIVDPNEGFVKQLKKVEKKNVGVKVM